MVPGEPHLAVVGYAGPVCRMPPGSHIRRLGTRDQLVIGQPVIFFGRAGA